MLMPYTLRYRPKERLQLIEADVPFVSWCLRRFGLALGQPIVRQVLEPVPVAEVFEEIDLDQARLLGYLAEQISIWRMLGQKPRYIVCGVEAFRELTGLELPEELYCTQWTLTQEVVLFGGVKLVLTPFIAGAILI